MPLLIRTSIDQHLACSGLAVGKFIRAAPSRSLDFFVMHGSEFERINRNEIGRVLAVGDDIAHVYGLGKVKAGEMVESSSGWLD